MAAIVKNKVLVIGGMTCVSCENKIQKKLAKTAGVKAAEVSYNMGKVKITYESDMIGIEEIKQIIEKLGYEIEDEKKKPDYSKILSITIIIFAIYMIMKQFGLLTIFYSFPEAEAGMEYGMLFIIGLLTSVHCVAMCGGINLSQCIHVSGEHKECGKKYGFLRPGLFYNFGRVLSYTILGGIIGAIGSVVN